MSSHAFQTNVLRDGQWVTETVSLEAALKASGDSGPSVEHRAERPTCGILSRTAVESPMVRWILPVRLRSKFHNDIAYIGKSFVQISELRPDGQVHRILRKNDFGLRIRNAVVLGEAPRENEGGSRFDDAVKIEEKEIFMGDASPLRTTPTSSLPPQMLVLILESCDLVFLFVRTRTDGSPEFVTTVCQGHRGSAHTGYHLVVNPSWRYLVAASPTGVFVAYELESLDTLHDQYAKHGSIRPVKSVRARSIQAVIQKTAFLHPRAEDDCHVILLLIVIRKEPHLAEPFTRMVVFDWELGADLKHAFAKEPAITSRLPDEYQMPVHVIPLMVQSAFIIVSQDSVVVAKNLLSGSPGYDDLEDSHINPTKLHHGLNEPLWTAWARPFRRDDYFARTDIIYLAREDGVVIYLEIDSAMLTLSVSNVVALDVNVDTAFAAAYDPFSDLLIIGGDSGSGGIWTLRPREELVRLSTTPNWSPAVDITVLNELPEPTTGVSDGPGAEHRLFAPKDDGLRKPDGIFSASGRGIKGSVTEWRWGVQAHIGLDIESGDLIRQSWAFTVNSPSGQSLCALLALPHSSMVLRFSGDLGQVDELTPDATHFDTSSRTLYAAQISEDMIIQVTETSVTSGNTVQRSWFSLAEALGRPALVADKAFCVDNTVVISAHNGDASEIHVLQTDQMRISQLATWKTQGEVTSLSLFRVSENAFVGAGLVIKGTAWLSVFSLNGRQIASKSIDSRAGASSQEITAGSDFGFDALTSICVVRENDDSVDLIVGTRCGRLISVRVSENEPEHITWIAETVGIAPVDVFSVSFSAGDASGAFACCDNNLIMLTDFSEAAGKFQNKHYVWATDSKDPAMPAPPIHWACGLRQSLSGHPDHMSIMLLAGSRMLLADLWPQVGPVPRSIPVGGTPTRVIYSRAWNCLVVGLVQDNKPTLAFIDAETGATMSIPCDKDRKPREHIKGLGQPNDRIFGLHEWLFDKDGRTFCFFLVTTKLGNLVVVSVNQTESRTAEGTTRALQYWSRYKKKLGLPVYSIVGDADGLIYCVDRTIHWDVLDLAEKKLKPVKNIDLDSPVTSLRVVNGKILALTTMHSLEVIDHRAQGRDGGMKLLHTDAVSRSTTHMVDAGDSVSFPDQWPVTLLSDQAGGITGVWIPWGQQHQDLSVAFSGMLSSPVRRFVRAQSRPLWRADEERGRYGTLPSSQDKHEIMGVSVDGSLQHLTLLGVELWRFLRLIQNLARKSPTMFPFTYRAALDGEDDWDEDELEPQVDHKSLHIDGDMLERCVKLRALEELVTSEAALGLFCEYLDGLEGGRWTEELRDMMDSSMERRRRYFELGYQVLAYLVATPL